MKVRVRSAFDRLSPRVPDSAHAVWLTAKPPPRDRGGAQDKGRGGGKVLECGARASWRTTIGSTRHEAFLPRTPWLSLVTRFNPTALEGLEPLANDLRRLVILFTHGPNR